MAKEKIPSPEEIKKIENEERELAQKLSDKYGRGSLDIETGTFTPAEEFLKSQLYLLAVKLILIDYLVVVCDSFSYLYENQPRI